MSPRPTVAAALAAFLLAPAAFAADYKAPTPPEGNRSCLVCHQGPAFGVEKLGESVHKDLSCTDCHAGYDFKAHEAQEGELSAEDQAIVEKLGTRSEVPRALLACGNCHTTEVDNVMHSAHTRWLREERPVPGPTCLSCHEDPHAIRKVAETPDAKRALSARCQRCHEDPALVAKAGLSTEPMNWRDSLHGRLVRLGSNRAPGCFDCHSNHGVQQAAAAGSPVSDENKVQTCAKCHPGANANFAAAFTHKPLTPEAQPGPFYVHFFFSWLTTLTLFALFLHVLLDLGAEIRRKLQKRPPEPKAPPGMPKEVLRFDLHQRIQHWLLLTSVILLTLSGWPIRAAAVNSSGTLLDLMGGLQGAALLHRIMAAVMGAAAAYHVAYLTWRLVQRKLVLKMVPAPRDLRDLMHNLAYLAGLRKDRPKFDKFSYMEKFDYWAVFWGVAIMGGTGLVRWFPVFFANVLPGWALYATQLAHGEEATLAASALFVWHFYNVHLRPSIFPMNWVWLTGRISAHALREEHGQEYQELAEKVAQKKDGGK